MSTLLLPTVPANVTSAREVFEFTVTPAVLDDARRVSPLRQPEPSLQKLGHDMADARREAFRASVNPDLPDGWIRSEVEVWRDDSFGDLHVKVALFVDPPELLGVWITDPGTPPRLASLRRPAAHLIGHCVVDGRHVYGPRP